MINEKKFIIDYNSFWNSLLPTMTQLVFRLNKSAITYDKQKKMLSDQEVRGLVNETAFNISSFRNDALLKGSQFNVGKKIFQDSKNLSWLKINKLEDSNSVTPPPINEFEVRALYESLELFLQKFRKKSVPILFKPKFPGCGFLEPCEGDILVGDILFEVKAGNRNFRGPDVRQLLVYYSLHFFETGHQFKHIGLINPRTGKYIIYNVDEVCYLLSGKTGLDLANEIQIFLLGYEISK